MNKRRAPTKPTGVFINVFGISETTARNKSCTTIQIKILLLKVSKQYSS